MRQITLPATMFDTLEGRLYAGNFAHEYGSAPITIGDVTMHRETDWANSATRMANKRADWRETDRLIRLSDKVNDPGEPAEARDWLHMALLAAASAVFFGGVLYALPF